MGSVLDRLLDRGRHTNATAAAVARPADGDLSDLAGHKYCLVVTYRRSGQGVPTPVWFGIDAGRAYFRTDASTAKVKRIRANPKAAIAPCTARGRPLGPPVECVARVLEGAAANRAEQIIGGNYGRGRRLYNLLFARGSAGRVYVELAAPAR
jgi:hypothetical protein